MDGYNVNKQMTNKNQLIQLVYYVVACACTLVSVFCVVHVLFMLFMR